MNNLIISFKRFIKNKNTVTIIGVCAIILILYVAYTGQINRATAPKQIPVATVTIQPRTKIDNSMVEFVSVATILVQNNVYQNMNDVIDKYTNYNTVIPAGSPFYKEALVRESDLPDSALIQLENGQVPYNFPVNMQSTYYNSIYPNNYIDIYMKATNEEGTLMVGKLIENIKVLAVKDSQGRHVFENTEETRTPAVLIFGVNDELNILLRKASYMSNFSVELFPVPHGVNGAAEVPGATVVSSQTLQEFINANTVPNDELVTPEPETPVEGE